MSCLHAGPGRNSRCLLIATSRRLLIATSRRLLIATSRRMLIATSRMLSHGSGARALDPASRIAAALSLTAWSAAYTPPAASLPVDHGATVQGPRATPADHAIPLTEKSC